MRNNRKGFTLIELLIVVAIIAILAAIAIPNFLQAQVRAKVARAKGEMRTLATALESYMVDENLYPDDIDYPWPWYLSQAISTPIAYIANSNMYDPFRQGITVSWTTDVRVQKYRYLNYKAEVEGHWDPTATGSWPGLDIPNARIGRAKYGDWRITSAGPDRSAGPNYSMADDMVYDPTNGTVSGGDLIRSQSDPDMKK